MPDATLTGSWAWSSPAKRAARNKSAVKAIHQYDTVAEETNFCYRFTPAPDVIDITDWGIKAYLSFSPGDGDQAPIKTYEIDDGIEIVSGEAGTFEVSGVFAGAEGTDANQRYVLSVYRDDIKWELARVYITVPYTAVGGSEA